jgi:hypothetical protein
VGAIEYAEDKLGVHTILEKVIEAREQLDRKLTELSEQRDAKRQCESDLSDRENEIAINEYAKHAELSQAALKEHVKHTVFKDEGHRGLRGLLLELTNSIEGLEYDRSMLDKDIKIGCARMEQLGGYFNYLAAVKNAAGTARTT